MKKNLKINMHLIIEINKCIMFNPITYIQIADNTAIVYKLFQVYFICLLTKKAYNHFLSSQSFSNILMRNYYNYFYSKKYN